MQAGHLRVRHAGGYCQERATLRPAARFTFRDVADAAVVVAAIAKVRFFDLVSAAHAPAIRGQAALNLSWRPPFVAGCFDYLPFVAD